jgi:tetratricopeptide (TPR) repeat protein
MAIRLSILGVLIVTLAAQAQSPQTPANCPPPVTPARDQAQTGNAANSGEQSKARDKASTTPCVTSKEPSAPEKFPFPGEPSATVPAGSSPEAPEAPVPSGKKPSAADKFPFPGSGPPMPGSESSSSSSSSNDSNSSRSSSSDDTSDAPAPASSGSPLDDKGDNPRAAVRKKLPKVQKLQSDDERAAEDLEVAKFYEDAGDLNAAYLRARDAVKLQPSDPEAHFVLGHLAQRLNKRAEAIFEFNSYIQLEPDGQKIRQAQKSLAQLQRP